MNTLLYQISGLAKFDYVVTSAKAHGLRLIVTLTNNWSDYGGMDVYVKQVNPLHRSTYGTYVANNDTQILNSANHDLFYTNSQVISAYQTYVSAFVTRYKTEPGILAWSVIHISRECHF